MQQSCTDRYAQQCQAPGRYN